MKKLLLLLFISLIFAYRSWGAESVPVVHSTAYEAGHIITTNPTKSVYWLTVSWITQQTRWLIIYDATTIPGDGALDPTKILYCAMVSLNTDPPVGNKSFDWTNHPLYRGSHGIVAIISVNAGGCTTKTADGNNNWITAGIN